MKSIAILLLTLSFSQVFAFQSFFSPTDNLDKVVVDGINEAKSSIDMAIYTFNSKPILEALINKLADNPKFKLRLLVRKANKKETISFLTPLYDQLKKNKYKNEVIRYVTTTNHHKYLITDGKTLLNSSGNFNDSKLAHSYDENLFICSSKCKGLVQSFSNEFNFLFNNSNSLMVDEEITSVVKSKRQTSRAALFTSFNFEPVIRSPKVTFKSLKSSSNLGIVESELIKVISKAKEIKIATGHFRSWPLAEALIKAHKKGTKIEVLLDSQEYISESYQDYENDKKENCLDEGKVVEICYKSGYHFGRILSDSGIKVFVKYYMASWNFIFAPQMHHKYMIVDGKTLYTGSYNWSKNAEFKTLENIAIIKNKNAVKSYLENFQNIKNYGKGKLSTLKSNWKNESKVLELKFDPMTLTFSEIDSLRGVACEKCPSTFCPKAGKKRRKVSNNKCFVEK